MTLARRLRTNERGARLCASSQNTFTYSWEAPKSRRLPRISSRILDPRRSVSYPTIKSEPHRHHVPAILNLTNCSGIIRRWFEEYIGEYTSGKRRVKRWLETQHRHSRHDKLIEANPDAAVPTPISRRLEASRRRRDMLTRKR